ncbi:MAG TPA: primosomal replication protein N [Burkholderiales bacterium]|nr:primosomal replication protein N [Burkholderiales bacterium]
MLNRVELSGRLAELGALRYTPAGVAAVEFKLGHESEQDEAGGRRSIQAEVSAIAFDTQARLLSGLKLDTNMKVQGFLAAKSKRSKRLVLHVTNIEFIEGEQHAAAAQR